MIGITGQLGGIAAAFSRTIARNAPGEKIIALGRQASSGWSVDRWRIGSMTSERDAREMLKDLSIVYYFCLTPPFEGRTYEGLDIDVALCDAMNFASVAGSIPDLRVVFITRFSPRDDRPMGSTWNFWREVANIFEENIKNLQIVKTTPMWSASDSETMGMISYAQHNKISLQDTRLFNLIAPIAPEYLMKKLVELHQNWPEASPRKHMLIEGEASVSYAALLQCIKSELSNHTIKRRLARLIDNSDAKQAARDEVLFIQSLDFHQVTYKSMSRIGEPNNRENVFRQCRDFVNEIGDVSLVDAAVSRIGMAARDEKVRAEVEVASQRRNYVYRIARYPRRSVSEIADLFIKWIPRYFQRAVRVEDLGSNRQMYRLSRVPLAELEKVEGSWQRCRILMKWPWGVKVDAHAQLLVTVTGTRDQTREILIVCEDGPQSSWFVLLMRGLMAAFGKYLRDYGVAE